MTSTEDAAKASWVGAGNIITAGNNINFNTTNNIYYPPASQSDDQEVIDWLLSLAGVNHYARQKDMYSNIASGTAEWILNAPEFEAWIAQDSGTLWGTGIPGAGKTILVSFLIHHLQHLQNKHAVLFAFCRFDDNLSVTQILAALVHHCFEALETARPHITASLYSPYKRTKAPPSRSELETVLEEVLGSAGKCFIVVDALDELQEDVREDLIGILTSINKSLFVTSRLIVIDALSALQKIDICAPGSDFQSMINRELEQLPKIRSLFRKNPGELPAFVDNIRSKSNGMLLLAKLYLSKLRGITTLASLRTAIKDLPATLDDMYEATLARIRALGDEEKSLAQRTIIWVMHASRDLTITELLYALAVDPDSTRFDQDALTNDSTIASACCGLITVEKERQNVRFIHYTTYEFFRSCWTSASLTEDRQLLEDPHGFAATICAVYIQPLGVVTQAINDTSDLEYYEKHYPFIAYAYENLGNHAYLSSQQHHGDLPEKLDQFLHNNSFVPLVWKSHYGFKTFDYGTSLHFGALHGLESLMRGPPDRFYERSKQGWLPLFFASANDQAYIVKLLLHMDEPGPGTIGGSVKNQNPAIQGSLCSPAADVNAKNLDGMTALHIASYMEQDSIIQLLLQCKNINVNAKSDEGQTALHIAVKADCKAAVELLLQCINIEAGTADNNGKTALHYAALYGSESIIKMLLQCNDINASATDVEGGTALHEAVSRNWDDCGPIIDMLIQSGCIDAGATDKNGRTALHVAAISGSESGTRSLLQCDNIDANAADDFGNTALYYAVNSDFDDYGTVLEMLLPFDNTDLNALDDHGDTVLHRAIYSVKLNSTPELRARGLRILFQCGRIDVNAANSRGETTLHCAVKECCEPVVEILLQCDKIDVNATDKKGKTALHKARDETMISMLLQHDDIKVGEVDGHGRTALHHAAKYGFQLGVKALLQCGDIDVGAADKAGMTALHYATSVTYSLQQECESVVQMLLQCDSINAGASDNEGMTALHYAAKQGYDSVVKMLLECDSIDAGAADGRGRTALHYVAELGPSQWQQPEAVVEMLLQCNKIDIGAVDNEGKTALHYAALHGHKSIVGILLQYGPIEAGTADNGTVIFYYAVAGASESLTRMLSHCDRVETVVTDTRGRTALHYAAEGGSESIVGLLLKLDGFDAWAVDESGMTALHCAAIGGSESVVRMLLKCSGVNANAGDNRGDTPLHHAAEKGYESVAKLLIRCGTIDINAAGRQGRTALHYAAIEGHTPIVELLLQCDSINVNAVDEEGHSPLYQASRYKRGSIVQLLLTIPNINEMDKIEGERYGGW